MKVEQVHDHEDLIEYCYPSDSNFLTKFHTEAGKDIKTCIQKEINQLTYAVELETYKLTEGNDLVGYFCKDQDMLVSFFILPKYRSAEIKTEFWKMIKSKFDGKFTVGVYDKNVPAKKFLLKNGCKMTGQANIFGHIAILFEYLGE